MMRHPQKQATGMSLIEVVIAIAISGFILASAASFVVSISDIWSKREQRYAFYEHVDGVNQFLKSNFLSAQIIPNKDNSFQNNPSSQTTPTSPSISANTNNTLPGAQTTNALTDQESDTHVFWRNPELNRSTAEPLLSFQIRENTPLLTNPQGIIPLENTLYLYFDPNEGLSLIHTSLLNETIESENDYQRTMLSPFVKAMTYIYWDSETETWESLSEPMTKPDDSNSYQIPNFLKLIFEYKDTQIERIIPIPKQSKHAILY